MSTIQRFLLLLFVGLVTAGCGGGTQVSPAIGSTPPSQAGSDDIASPALGSLTQPQLGVGEGGIEIPPDAEQVLVDRDINGNEYNVPPMDPALFAPDDKEIPTLYFFQDWSIEPLYGAFTFSALVLDDTGVNLIILLIDGKQCTIVEGGAHNYLNLNYHWDTTQWEDGAHEIILLIRDNAGTLGKATESVSIDNATDYEGPEITLQDVSYRFKEWEFEAENYSDSNYYCKEQWIICGTTLFQLTADDRSKVVRFELLCSDGPSPEWNYVSLGSASCDRLNVEWDTTDWVPRCYLLAEAEDGHGNVSTYKFKAWARNSVTSHPTFTNADGEPLEGADVYIMPDWWQAGSEIDPLNAFDLGVTNKYGRFVNSERIRRNFIRIPVGHSSLVIVFEDKIKVESLVVVPYGFRNVHLTPEQTQLD